MPQKILVVDEDAGTRALLRKMLERAGYATLLTTTFQQGKRALAASAPDLLIADLRLGEFNGLQLLITSPTRIPTIMLTGFPDAVLAHEARNLGAGYITKPFSSSALLALIRDKLVAVPGEVTYPTNRRWARKQVVGEMQAHVQESPARILDISYGGVRFEFESAAEREIPTSFRVTLPESHLSVQVDLVWKSRRSGRSWLCGAALSDANRAITHAWYGLVDGISFGAPLQN
jgi:DNA-binding response OmpR family regulator